MNQKEKKVLGNPPKHIEVPVWWSPGGGVSYRRDCLSPDHPEHTYNYIKTQLGVDPELYGMLHPDAEQYKDYTREQLMGEILTMRRQLRSVEHMF
jgi:hypothetical protein